jgi:hypothetical protein
MVTISPANLEKRIKLSNPEVMKDYYRQGKSVMLTGIQIFFLFLASTRSRNWQK